MNIQRNKMYNKMMIYILTNMQLNYFNYTNQEKFKNQITLNKNIFQIMIIRKIKI